MTSRFALTSDNQRIAYDASGSGPALLLLHGFSDDRSLWRRTGWVERLQPDYTVIAMDFRGCGESAQPVDPAAYTLERHLADVEAVLDACQVDQARLWGWSFGATAGLQLTAQSSRVSRAVIAGTYFGRIFTESFVNPKLAEFEVLAAARATGGLDLASLSPEARAFAETHNPAVYVARLKAMLAWPIVEPADVRVPTLVYTGSRDGNVVVQLGRQREAIGAAGLELRVLDGLDHAGLINASDVVSPLVLGFLQA